MRWFPPFAKAPLPCDGGSAVAEVPVEQPRPGPAAGEELAA